MTQRRPMNLDMFGEREQSKEVQIVGGRYALPDPATGEIRKWSRVSTILDCIGGGGRGLEVWTQRGIMRGLATNPQLRSMLAGSPDDKAVHDEVLDAAKELGGLNDARRHGTAVHGAVERALLGQSLALEPGEPVARDLDAVLQLLDGEGLREQVRAIETVVMHASCAYAGRIDLMVGNRVLDVKTGKEAHRGDKARRIKAQLAAYARSTHAMVDGELVEMAHWMPNIDIDVALVLSVRDGVAQLYEADLNEGWHDFQMALREHERRSGIAMMPPVGRRYLAVGRSDPMPSPQDVDAGQVAILDGLRAALAERSDPVVESITAVAPPVEAVDAPKPARKPSTCGRCGATGHTSRGCKALPVQPEPLDVPTASAPTTVTPTALTVEGLLDDGRTCECSQPPGWTALVGASRPDVHVCGECGLPALSLPAPARSVGDELTEARSRDELTAIWQRAVAAGAWTDEHLALATSLAPNLPEILPSF